MSEDRMEQRAWRLKSEVDQVDALCLEANALMARLKIGEQDRFAVELLLREALDNAIVHGNLSDPEKAVHCRLAISPRLARIEVVDQGQGFNWREKIGSQASAAGESGRGLSIIRLYASSFLFNELGNELVITRILDEKGVRYGK